jgi:hypothetical protein
MVFLAFEPETLYKASFGQQLAWQRDYFCQTGFFGENTHYV